MIEKNDYLEEMSSLTHSPAWKALEEHKKKVDGVQIKELFAKDPERFNKFHANFKDIIKNKHHLTLKQA